MASYISDKNLLTEEELADVEEGMSFVDDGEGSASEDEVEEVYETRVQKFVAEKFKFRKMKEKRNFQTFIERKIKEGIRKAVRKQREEEGEDVNAEKRDDELTVLDLLPQGTRNITDPRSYQLELFERAKNENVIAVLDTGSGKTLIACLLIRHIIDLEMQDRANGKDPRSCFFLTDNVTLAIQQWNVLKSNLDAKVGLFHGSSSGQISSKCWENELREHPIIVMTSDYLLNCLTHGLVRMKDINLICFDEAHRAKKNHSYARIVHDFYRAQPRDSRPKIFGMTASPVDARVDVIERSLELEGILNARIVTARNLEDLRHVSRKPTEHVVQYDRAPNEIEPTPLFLKLKEAFSSAKFFEKMLFKVKAIHRELGPWCADQVWMSVITDKLITKMMHRQQMEGSTSDIQRIDEEIEAINIAKEYVSSRVRIRPPNIAAGTEDITPKVRALLLTLSDMFTKDPDGKCIVFVQKRNAANVLALLIQHAKEMPDTIKVAALVGQRPSFTGEDHISIKQQMMIVSKFRRGRLNCLIATSVAEEGLDIPDCSRIIRFDLYTTMIQYIQSRGRARHAASEYIHMMERRNPQHLDALRTVKQAEGTMRRFCEGLPEDRMLNGKLVTSSDTDWDATMELFYEEPSTGAKLTPHSAMSVLNHYVSVICEGSGTAPQYDIFPQRGGFTCTVRLPAQAPFRSVKGELQPSRIGSRRSAAFKAVVKLRKFEELNANLMPVYVRALPEGANAHLAVNETKKNVYPFQLTPELWSEVITEPPRELYGVVVDFYPRLDYIPYMFLTTRRLPKIPTFPIFLDDLRETTMRFTSLEEPIKLDEHPGLFERINNLNFKSYEDNFGKYFDREDALPFWVAPVSTINYNFTSNIYDILDHVTLDLCAEVDDLSLGDDRAWDFSQGGRVYSDRLIGIRRRYIIKQLAPPEATAWDIIEKPKNIKSALDWNVFLFSHNAKTAKEIEEVSQYLMLPQEQLVVGVPISQHIILLKPPVASKIKKDLVPRVLCPSRFRVSPMSGSFCVTMTTFPSFVHKLNTYLHAKTVFDKFYIEVNPATGLEAITKGEDIVNGAEVTDNIAMGRNYERLEFLGDCFLKLATTLCQFVGHHHDSEYELHVKRMGLLCNKNLFEHAIRLDVPKYIQATPMTRHGWYPKVRQAKGPRQKLIRMETPTQRFNDKTIADVCEAIIGAALHDKGLDAATQVCHYLLNTQEHTMIKFEDYRDAYVKPPYQLAAASASTVELCKQLESEIGYTFKYPRLAQCAFTHSSNPGTNWDNTPNYQRIEFLGDALLDLAIIQYLFETHPDAGPQWLTEHKMAMVSNKFLAILCVMMGLHLHLRYSGSHMLGQISAFMDDINDTKREEEEKPGGLKMNWWMGVKATPPKALSDVIESIIGAMFLDSDFDFSTTQRFFDTFIKPYFVDMSLYDTYANQHPTTAFSNLMNELGCEAYGIKQFVLPADDSPEPAAAGEENNNSVDNTPQILCAILIHGEVFSSTIAPSIKLGRVKVCEKALKALKGMDASTFAAKICDCAAQRTIVEQLRLEDEEEKKRSRVEARG